MAAPREMTGDGVNVGGYFRAEVGVGEAGRLLVTALKAAGIPYALVPFDDVPSRQEARFDDWGEGAPVYDTNIVCVNANALPAFIETVGWSFFQNRYTIGMWWWEVEEFPPQMRLDAQFVDEVWVGSRHTADAIAPVITKPVLVCPPPVVPREPRRARRSSLGLPDGFLFLFSFDFNSVLDRKNPTGLIRAFTRAFAPGEGPTLVLKSINGYQHPAKLESLRASASGRPDILVQDRYLDDEDLQGLVATCDAYVSLHRAEGFGLTMAEAMALGKPVIATEYGGNLEFMNDRNSFLVPYQLVSIPPGCDPYPAGSRWAEPDVAEAAAALRAVYDGGPDVERRRERARRDIRDQHSPECRARFLRRRLETIRELRRGKTLSREELLTPPRPRLAMRRTADLDFLMHDQRGRGIGRFAAPVRRAMYRRLLGALLAAQSDYNRAAAEAIDALSAAVGAQDKTLRRLTATVDHQANAEDLPEE